MTDHTHLIFRITPQTEKTKAEPQAISGKEQYRALIERNRVFGSYLMSTLQPKKKEGE
jgi:hypothetical protein